MKNKKTMIIIVECVVIVFILVVYYFVFMDNPGNINNNNLIDSMTKIQEVEQPEKINFSGNSQMRPYIEADIEVINNIVSIKENISLKEAVQTIYLYIPSKNNAKTSIKSLQAGEGFTNVIISDANLRVDFEEKQSKIYIEYEIVLNNSGETLSYGEDSIFLTNFLIAPAVYKNGQPVFIYKSSFGDPYIYDINHYSIRLKTDKHFTAYAPGKLEEKDIDESKITVFQSENLRDFPIVIFKNAAVDVKQYGEKKVYYVNSIDAEEYVRNAFEFGSSAIGEYPYEEFFVVKVPISLQGMEFSNMVFLSESCFKSSEVLKRVAYHEVFHQWFYGIIGTDQLNEPFFDEGLVNYFALMLSGNELNRYYNQKLFELHLKDYNSENQYYNLAYNDSAVYFFMLHKKLGDNFYNMLKQIYTEKSFAIIYFDEFLKYADEYLGGN